MSGSVAGTEGNTSENLSKATCKQTDWLLLELDGTHLVLNNLVTRYTVLLLRLAHIKQPHLFRA
jgi:hypothetical protein